MNEIPLVERLAQGLLAVTVVFAIVFALQLTLSHEGTAFYAMGASHGVPHAMASRFF